MNYAYTGSCFYINKILKPKKNDKTQKVPDVVAQTFSLNTQETHRSLLVQGQGDIEKPPFQNKAKASKGKGSGVHLGSQIPICSHQQAKIKTLNWLRDFPGDSPTTICLRTVRLLDKA